MALLKAKLCGLHEADARSIKSMLSVANDHLSNEWLIIDSGEADLYIYSFDTDEGVAEWDQHNPEKVSVLLTTEDELSSDDEFDILLKKPLRTKNFSTVLSESEQRILAINAQHGLSDNSAGFLSSLKSGFGKLLGKKNPLSTPHLYLPTPENEVTATTPIIDIKALRALLASIDVKSDNSQTEQLSNNLIALNRSTLVANKRLALLDLYSNAIHHLINNHLTNRTKIKQDSHANYIKDIHAVTFLIDELVIGYQCCINDEIQSGSKPKSGTPLLTAINRAAEFISLSVFYASIYYFSPPKGAINKLHQLYLYCEYHQVVDHQLKTSKSELSSFKKIYAAQLLSCIGNTSRLDIHDIMNLPHLLNKFADKVQIYDSTDKPEAIGCFSITMSSDNGPKAIHESETKSGSGSQLRTFDTHAMLVEIEKLFQQSSSVEDTVLLKKIIPQFNASYTRSFERKPCSNPPKAQLIKGVAAIHNYLTTHTLTDSFRCTVRNQSKGGVMLSSDMLDSYYLEIGTIVSIIDINDTQQLAAVRWLTTNPQGSSRIGLEFLATPRPVQMSDENKNNNFVGLILSIQRGAKKTETIIVDKGTYLPLQTINVTDDNNTYKISIDSSIENTFNCEQFSFKIKR